MMTPEMIRRLRDPERNPPDMAWRSEIADRLEIFNAQVVDRDRALAELADAARKACDATKHPELTEALDVADRFTRFRGD
jgi:hypothetical protein